MIRYTLKCSNGHSFESWFQSSDAYEKLASSGFLACSECGDGDVRKSLMAPKVTTARKKAKAPAAPEAEVPAIATPKSDSEKAIAQMKAEVEKNSEYVGMNFASEARAMHDGDTETRAIYGEAKAEDAKALIEDGVPVAPLPFIPKRSTN